MTLAVIFDSIGFGEWFVLLAVVLIVVGPRRLPSAARTVGQYYAKFRRAAENFKRQLMDMDTEMGRAADSVEKAASDAFTNESAPSEEEPDGSPDHDDYDYERYGDDYDGMHDDNPESSDGETGADDADASRDGSDVPPDVEAVSSDEQPPAADAKAGPAPAEEPRSPGDMPQAEVP